MSAKPMTVPELAVMYATHVMQLRARPVAPTKRERCYQRALLRAAEDNVISLALKVINR